MASVPVRSRPRLFDAEQHDTAPTSPLFFAAYLLLVSALWWIATHPNSLLLSGAAGFSLLAGLLAAGRESWTNPVEWERRWEASSFAVRQRRLEAQTRRLLALTAKYAAGTSTIALSLFVVGLFVDMPIPVVFLVVGGLIVTFFLTVPLCLIVGFLSGALLPAWLREEEPARFAVFVERLTAPAVRPHAACASVGALIVASILRLLSIG